MDARRFMVFDRKGSPLFDLDDRIVSATRTEKINGEHSLDIVTSQPLEEGMRIVVRDDDGTFREWVIDEPDESHDSSGTYGTYGCTWSMQYDLTTCYGDELWLGTYSEISASSALGMVLNSQSTWTVGNVTVTTTGGTSLYDASIWEYLAKLIEVWGGEMEPRIEVDSSGVVTRYVDWLAHVGSEDATRRFDLGIDCTVLRRKVAPGPRYCRIIPRGGSEGTDNDGISYSARVGVEEEGYLEDDTGEFVHPDGANYVEDTQAAIDFRVSGSDGGWRYPSKVVTYDTDDPEELLNLAMADIEGYTRPDATYEISVEQLDAVDRGVYNTHLGDEVQVVDRNFGDAPLRLQARVVEISVNELDANDSTFVLGNAMENIESSFKSIMSALDDVTSKTREITSGGTLVYLDNLIDRINSEVNATGGWFYVVPGVGTRTYDKEVTDASEGDEADQVVEQRGGYIRIADSRDSNGDWEWRTLFESGRIATDMIVGGEIVTGYIQSADGSFYIDLDSGVISISPSVTSIGDISLEDAINDAKRYANDYLHYESGAVTLGTADGAVKNVITSTKQIYRTAAGDIAWYGLDEDQDIWKLYIDNAQVNDMLQFGDFAWIARSNGNMTVKWIGD